MPTEMRIPFGVGDDGRISVESNPDKQITQRVRALVGTSPGERVMRAVYGVPLATMVFDLDDELVQMQLEQMIKEALARYEPGAFLRAATPLENKAGDGLVSVAIDVGRTESPTTSALSKSINTAIISVGGHVSEVVRG